MDDPFAERDRLRAQQVHGIAEMPVTALAPEDDAPYERADQELADIERRVAADRAVIDAAKAVVEVWRQWKRLVPGSTETPATIPIKALAVAVDVHALVPAAVALRSPSDTGHLVLLQGPDGSVHARPGLGETLKLIETEFFVFTGDNPDTATVGVNADSIDDAAGLLGAMPGSAIAVRHIYAGEWAVNRPLCVHCGGTRWVDDENWQLEDYELAQGRVIGSGRIPCGGCNEGGWSEPDGKESEAGR